jgi:hypothetical protein
MARILHDDGSALIQVPVDPDLSTTYETFAPKPSDREREYGQHDHARTYAADVEDRLGQAFTTVRRVDYAATFAAAEQRRMGLVEPTRRRGKDIYVCSQPRRPTRQPGTCDGTTRSRVPRGHRLSASAASARPSATWASHQRRYRVVVAPQR